MKDLTIAEASRHIAAKSLSPVDLVQERLQRVGEFNSDVAAFITITADQALEQARAAERRITKCGPTTPLDGIPIGHKDLIDTAGIRTTAHSKLLEDHVPTSDATVVTKLRQAGAISLGKLATLEFALAGPSFDLPWPPARNPWNTEYFTGGSSTGTAAAIAAGMILGGTGTDTAGSIRGPAAFCGVSGIKPTYGRCSRKGVFPLAQSFDSTGPMAWTAEDCAILLQQMAGHDPLDPASSSAPVPDYVRGLGQGVKGLRVGVIRQFYERDHAVCDETRRGIDRSLEILETEGAILQDVVLSPLQAYSTATRVIMNCEASSVHRDWIRTRTSEYGQRMRNRLIVASLISATDYVDAQRRRRELTFELTQTMRNVDVVISAITAGEASRMDEIPLWDGFGKPSLAAPWNLTGLPAISVCTGFGDAGLPLGLQIGGRAFDEATILRVAHTLEKATPWRQRRPRMVSDVH